MSCTYIFFSICCIFIGLAENFRFHDDDTNDERYCYNSWRKIKFYENSIEKEKERRGAKKGEQDKTQEAQRKTNRRKVAKVFRFYGRNCEEISLSSSLLLSSKKETYCIEKQKRFECETLSVEHNLYKICKRSFTTTADDDNTQPQQQQ